MNGSHNDSDGRANNPLPANGSSDANQNPAPPSSNSLAAQSPQQPPPDAKRTAGAMGPVTDPTPMSGTSGSTDMQWPHEQIDQAPLAHNSIAMPQQPKRVAGGQIPSAADPLVTQVASNSPNTPQQPKRESPRVGKPIANVPKVAQQPKRRQAAMPHVSTTVLPSRVMNPIAGQPPSFRESLVAILVICVLFLFLLGMPIVAVIIVLLGIAGTLLSALLSHALPVLLTVGIAIVIALLFIAWLSLLLEMRNQFRTLTRAFRTSAKAVKDHRTSSLQRPLSDGGVANVLAQEAPDNSQQETQPMPGGAADDGSTGGQRASGGVVGWGERVEAAQWETREKEDKSDPVNDTDQIALPLEKSRGQWAIIGSSRIGKSHEYDGKYREDSLGAAIVGNWQVAAVADGGGSYKLARIGAAVATRAAIDAIKQQIEHSGSSPLNRDLIASALTAGIQASYRAIHSEAGRRQQEGQQITVKDLRTTLLLLVHCETRKPRKRHWVGGIQVGDGIIVARDGTGKLHWLGTPDTGPTGNEVLFLTDVPDTPEEWEQRVRVEFIEGETIRCLAMTDGVSDDFLPVDKNLKALEEPLYGDVLRKRSPKEAAQKLETLIGYDRTGSFDDRTVVCIYKAE